MDSRKTGEKLPLNELDSLTLSELVQYWKARAGTAERDLRELEADVEQTYVPRADLEAAERKIEMMEEAISWWEREWVLMKDQRDKERK